MKNRCINIDWLECYCLEPHGEPRNADYFRERGWVVNERQYGTRVYDEMFTLMDFQTNHPFLEVRRKPVGNKSSSGVMVIDPDSCHLRLVNRYCYFDNAAKLMERFIIDYGYTFMRISRIDICLDFEYFDSGDDPRKFIRRYIQGKFSKINQCNLAAHGKDWWDGRDWNSLSWGSPKSQISTKLYNKTLEIKEAKDKPYIRQAWAITGLVDDFIELCKVENGVKRYPQIYRLEFSIKSSVKRWFVIEDYNTGKKQLRSVRNELDRYYTRQDLLNVFASLSEHYFHFKKFQQGIRKDRCEDKILWKFQAEISQFYTVERVAVETPANTFAERLRKRLEVYRSSIFDENVRSACTTIIEDLIERHLRNAANNPYDHNEVDLLRQLISRRIQSDCCEPLAETVEKVKAYLNLEQELFT